MNKLTDQERKNLNIYIQVIYTYLQTISTTRKEIERSVLFISLLSILTHLVLGTGSQGGHSLVLSPQ